MQMQAAAFPGLGHPGHAAIPGVLQVLQQHAQACLAQLKPRYVQALLLGAVGGRCLKQGIF